jgi:hypothetical protein
MNLYRVGCWRLTDQEDDEPRVAVVAAGSKEEAVEMCRAKPGSEVYDRFEVLDAVVPTEGAKAVPSSPARVIGFEGDRPGTWK